MPISVPEYNQSKTRRTLILIVSIIVVFAAVWAYVFIGQKPRVADGSIQDITVIPLHSETRQGGTMREGYGGSVDVQDQTLVWVAFQMKNLTRDVPLYENGQKATLTLPDGQQLFSAAQSPTEIAKLRNLPQVSPVKGELVPPTMTLMPGQSTQGLALFAFPVKAEVWKTRREFSVSVAFNYQRDLAMQEPARVP